MTALPFTSDLQSAPLFRITVDPTASTGLRAISQIAVDKAVTLPRGKLGEPIGRMDPETMARVNRAIASSVDWSTALNLAVGVEL